MSDDKDFEDLTVTGDGAASDPAIGKIDPDAIEPVMHRGEWAGDENPDKGNTWRGEWAGDS